MSITPAGQDRPRIVLDPHGRTMDEVFAPDERARLASLADLVWARDEPMPVPAALAAMNDAVAFVSAGWRYGPLPDDTPRLRAIIDVAGGFPPELDYEACFRRGVRVLTAAPGFGPQVSEMALALALAASRAVVRGDREIRARTERWMHAGNVDAFLLFGKTVGIVGFGSIARSLVALLAPFDCPILAYDPWLADGYLRSLGVRPVPLPALLERSRVIFVLAAPTAENEALLGRSELERIDRDAVLVLMSRASVVDFESLTEMLLAGRFRAALDVFPEEPLPHDHPIRDAEVAVLSAHRAGSVREGLWELGRLVVDDLEAIVAGLPPRRCQEAAPELISRLFGPMVPGRGLPAGLGGSATPGSTPDVMRR